MKSEPDCETVHRVCHAIKIDGCKNCPATEFIEHHGDCTRGCYLQAAECVNIVETGNPWRKTENVKAPWTVITASHRKHPQTLAEPTRREDDRLLRLALERCRERFAEYQASHEAKGTEDGRQKAIRNEAMVNMIDLALKVSHPIPHNPESAEAELRATQEQAERLAAAMRPFNFINKVAGSLPDRAIVDVTYTHDNGAKYGITPTTVGALRELSDALAAYTAFKEQSK